MSDSIASHVVDMARPISDLEVKYEGDWQKMDTLMKYMAGGTFNRGIKRDIAKSQRDFLTGLKRNLVSGLGSGGASIGAAFKPHSPDYAGGTVGVKGGYYLNALKNTQIKQKGYITTLTFSKGGASFVPPGRKKTVGEYALIFEMGTKNRPYPQPPRPLWGQAYAFTGGKKGVLKNMVGAVGRRLSKMGINIRMTKSGYIK